MDIIDLLKEVEERVEKHKLNKNWIKLIKYLQENKFFSLKAIYENTELPMEYIIEILEYLLAKGYIHESRIANAPKYSDMFVIEEYIIQKLLS